MNAVQANAISMSKILHHLGYLPQRPRGRDCLFFSPLHHERTPGFHVDLVENVWFDFCLEKGGDVVDFAQAFLNSRLHHHDALDALHFLASLVTGAPLPLADSFRDAATPSPLEIVQIRTLQCPGLCRYLTDTRKIPLDLARKYLVEVEVVNRATGKTAFMFGMRNEDGVYVLRSAFAKGGFGTQDVTVIRGTRYPAKEVHLFGNAIDFLSSLADQEVEAFPGDSIVLHRLSFLPLALPYIEGYDHYNRMFLWLDNDRAGEKAADIFRRVAQRETHLDVCEMNRTYSPFKDVNQYRVHRLEGHSM